jgi:deoxycytidylate deaminase
MKQNIYEERKDRHLIKAETYIGKTINNFTISSVYRNKTYKDRIYCVAICKCSKVKNIRLHHVIKQNKPIRSCGCLIPDKATDKRVGAVWNVKKDSEAAFNKVIRDYINGANIRGLEFKLERAEFSSLIFNKCGYCGEPPAKVTKTKGGEIKHNGIDRLDNDRGYVLDNCITCCTKCNMLKKNLNSDDFLATIEKILLFNKVDTGLSINKLDYYYQKALTASELSDDPKTKVGAILIRKFSGAIVESGTNTFSEGSDLNKLPKDTPDKHNFIIHAETNLIFNCAKKGISTKNSIIFVTLSPCLNCIRACFQSGVHVIYFKDIYSKASNINEYYNILDMNIKIEKEDKYYKLILSPC